LPNGKNDSNFASVQKVEIMSHLTEAQRYEIFALKQVKFSQTAIAEKINKYKSMIIKELKRNNDKRTADYKPELAQRKYEQRKKEKPKFIRFTDYIKQLVITGLENDLSAEQIAGRAKRGS
jgi:IS30 family transposase